MSLKNNKQIEHITNLINTSTYTNVDKEEKSKKNKKSQKMLKKVLQGHFKLSKESHNRQYEEYIKGYSEFEDEIFCMKVTADRIRICTDSSIWVYNYEIEEDIDG